MAATSSPWYERVVLALLVLGPTLACVGAAASAFGSGNVHRYGIWAGASGLLIMALSVALSYPLAIFRTVLRKGQEGEEYAQMRYYSQLKASSILLNLLWIICLVGLLLSYLARIKIVDFNLPAGLGARFAAILSCVLVLNHVHAHWLSLRVPLQRTSALPIVAFHYMALALAALAPLVAFTLLERTYRVSSNLVFTDADAPVFLLIGAVVASAGLFFSRPIPNLLQVFREDRTPYHGRTYVSRTKSILLPAVTAFAILFIVLFILLIFGVGASGLRQPVQFSVFIFVAAAMMAGIFVSVRLARTEDTLDLYRIKTSPEARMTRLILGVSLPVAGLLVLMSVLLLRGVSVLPISPSRWIDLLCIALLVGMGPYGFYLTHRLNRIRRLEERFPDFLRDVAASHRSGLTLAASVQIASKGDYAALTPEIRKMADQLSWNIPFNEALQQLLDRVRTPLIERAVSLIIEASRSGGATTDVLLAAARDAREIKNLETERRNSMSLYTIVIYVTFFVFLAVAAILYDRFVPEIIRSSRLAAGSATAAGLSFAAPSKDEFRAFYFLGSIVQAIGNGFVAGLFQYGRTVLGLRHAFLMVLFTYVTFTFVFP